jgi:undecaprenyl-diphosphatase
MAFTEAFIQPIPPDALVIPMAANASDPLRLISIFLVVTISSVLGSLVAWWMGDKWGQPLLDRFASESAVRKFNMLVERFGSFGIFIAAFTPIPYKVLGWCAGIGRMERHTFVLAGFIGRSMRFGLEVLVIGVYGEQFIDFLTGWGFIFASLGGAILLYPVWRWWEGLEESPIED